MPVFGYSEHDLDERYERGVRNGRTRCTHELLNALNDLFPDLVHITNRDSYSDIPDIIRGLRRIQEQERSRCSRQKSKIEFLQYLRSRLEAEINALESGKLHATIDRLAAERDRLKQDVAAMQNELNQSRVTHQSERQKLLDEIEHLDGLVVEYESKMQNAR